MSVVKQVLEIKSPTRNNPIELVKGEIQPCGYCSGNGFFWRRDEFGDGFKQACPLCKGAKYLISEIAITWRPAEE